MTIDILMPFWGRFDHFRAAVESVLAQRDGDWRLTIIDDRYPDAEPGEWARSIDDSRVRFVRNEQNLGPSRNYNKAVGLATSEHVVIMGCDDLMAPDYIAHVTDLLLRFPDADVVQPGVSVIDENGDAAIPLPDRVKSWYRLPAAGGREYRGEEIARSLLRGNWTYFPSLVWRRARLTDGFRTDLDVVQDLAKLFQIIAEGGALVVDDDPVFFYRRHSGSVSAKTGVDGSKFAQERTLFREAEARSRELGWSGAARAARWHLSSRLSALTQLPRALRQRDGGGRRVLGRHVFGGLGATSASRLPD